MAATRCSAPSARAIVRAGPAARRARPLRRAARAPAAPAVAVSAKPETAADEAEPKDNGVQVEGNLTLSPEQVRRAEHAECACFPPPRPPARSEGVASALPRARPCLVLCASLSPPLRVCRDAAPRRAQASLGPHRLSRGWGRSRERAAWRSCGRARAVGRSLSHACVRVRPLRGAAAHPCVFPRCQTHPTRPNRLTTALGCAPRQEGGGLGGA